jgi:hypothetical protein
MGRGIGTAGAVGCTCQFPGRRHKLTLPNTQHAQRVGSAAQPSPQVENTTTPSATTMLHTGSERCRELEQPDIANFSISMCVSLTTNLNST